MTVVHTWLGKTQEYVRVLDGLSPEAAIQREIFNPGHGSNLVPDRGHSDILLRDLDTLN